MCVCHAVEIKATAGLAVLIIWIRYAAEDSPPTPCVYAVFRSRLIVRKTSWTRVVACILVSQCSIRYLGFIQEREAYLDNTLPVAIRMTEYADVENLMILMYLSHRK
jgi:hypothetical protein